MRGKHSTAASNRRERAELETRAATAEARVERLEKELGELRESSKASVGALRTALSEARKDRDASVAPTLKQAEDKIRELLAQRNDAVERAGKIQDKWNTCAGKLRDVLMAAGFTGVEATEILMATVMPDGQARTIHTGPKTSNRDPQMVLAVQVARGERHPTDALSKIRKSAG